MLWLIDIFGCFKLEAYDKRKNEIVKGIIFFNLGGRVFSYAENGNLTGITTAKAGTMLDSVSYTHDNVGNRITKSLPEESWTYSYDPVYRLTQTVPTGAIHQPEVYTYDAVATAGATSRPLSLP